MAISQKLKELLKLRRWQNNQDFEGFSDLQKLDFWMKDFRISGFLEAVAISRKQRELPEIRWWQMSGGLRAFQIFEREKIFFLIHNFWIWWRYLRHKKNYQRSTGGKMTEFSGAFWFLDPVTISWKRKELPKICWWQNDRNFESFLDWQKYLRVSCGVSARWVQRTKSRGQKGLQLEVRVQRSPRTSSVQ